jgi:hypothetical protein
MLVARWARAALSHRPIGPVELNDIEKIRHNEFPTKPSGIYNTDEEVDRFLRCL